MTAKRTSKKTVSKKTKAKKASKKKTATRRAGSHKPAGKKATKKKVARTSTARKASAKSKPAAAKKAKKASAKSSGAARKPAARPRSARVRKPPPLDLTLLRQQLVQKHADLLAAYTNSRGETRQRESDGTEDYIDYAVSSYDRDFSLSLTELERSQLNLVEEALKRIDRNEYGLCTQCERPIPAKRLEVQPWAIYCVRCQELADSGVSSDSLQFPGEDDDWDEPVVDDEIEVEDDDADEDDEKLIEA